MPVAAEEEAALVAALRSGGSGRHCPPDARAG